MVDIGEGTKLLEQIHEMSKDVMEDLVELDNKLSKLQNTIETKDEIDKDELLQQIKDLRTTIGAIEHEDSEEMEEEEILESMMKKLKNLIEMALG